MISNIKNLFKLNEKHQDIENELKNIKIDQKKLLNELNELKTKNTLLDDENQHLKNKFDELNNKINQMTKVNLTNEKILNSYHFQFQTIFLDHDLKSKGILKSFQDLGSEFINFIMNICKKYELNCWLDYGTLLGAVRHNGYIPWDDDLDLGMMRKDFNKFMQIFDDEVKLYNLEDNIVWNIDVITSKTWVQSFIKIYYFVNNGAYIGVDIFPYDFLIEKNENTINFFKEEKLDFHKKIMKNIDRTVVEKEYYEKLNLTFEQSDFVIPGVENPRGFGGGEYRFEIMETKDIFPLTKMKFDNYNFYCPHHSDIYLKKIYGDYYNIPKIIHHHDVISKMYKIPGVEKSYQNNTKKLSDINQNFNF